MIKFIFGIVLVFFIYIVVSEVKHRYKVKKENDRISRAIEESLRLKLAKEADKIERRNMKND